MECISGKEEAEGTADGGVVIETGEASEEKGVRGILMAGWRWLSGGKRKGDETVCGDFHNYTSVHFERGQ
jgi:hypothetical protein